MFNDNRTFLIKILATDFTDYADLLPQRQEEYSHKNAQRNKGNRQRGHRDISQLGVLGKLCSKSVLLPQSLTFVHKAIEMALFKSWRKRCFIRRKDAQSAQKLA